MFKKIKQRVNSSKLLKSIILMASGSAGAQALTMLFSPIVTRIYSPDAIGELGTFVAILNILLPLSALTLPAAIVLPKRNETANRIVWVSIVSCLSLALTTLLVTVVFGDSLVSLLNLSIASSYLLFLPVAMLLAGTYQITQQYLIRLGQFRVIAKTSLIQSLLTNTAKVSSGLFFPYASTLILVQTLSYLAFLLLHLPALPVSIFRGIVNPRIKLRQVLGKYQQFPLFQLPQQLLNAVSVGLPVILLTSLFSPSIAGFYALSRSIMTAPSVILSKAVGDAFYPQLATLRNQRKPLYPVIIKSTLMLFVLGFIPFGIVFFWGPSLFEWVFGQEWRRAGEIASWLALWVWFMFSNPPALKAIMVLNKQHIALIINASTLALRVGALTLGALLYQSPVIAIIGYVLASILHNVLVILLAIVASKQNYPVNSAK